MPQTRIDFFIVISLVFLASLASVGVNAAKPNGSQPGLASLRSVVDVGRIVLQFTARHPILPFMQRADKPVLLSVIELGGYPNFTSLYESAGYQVVSVVSVRRALSAIKQQAPDIIVAEFNFQSDFRDRTSSLESLLAAVQQRASTRIIVFYQKEHAHQLDRLRARFPTLQALTYPIDPTHLAQALTPPTS